MKKVVRKQNLDILRGTAVIFMIITHVVSELYTGTSIILSGLELWGATVSFSIFLFTSAAVYATKIENGYFSTKKTLGRSIKLLFWYFAVAISISIMGQNIGEYTGIAKDILLLNDIPEYTEFILAFVLYGILTAIAYPLLKLLVKSKLTVISIGISSLLLSSIFYYVSWGDNGVIELVKALLIGSNDVHTFGILTYLSTFLCGYYWGYLSTQKDTKKITKYEQLLALTTIGYIAFAFVIGVFNWHRFPPSIDFLMWGALYSISLLALLRYIGSYIDKLSILAYLGRNALHYYVYHVVIIFSLTQLLKVSTDKLHTFALWLVSLFVGVFLLIEFGRYVRRQLAKQYEYHYKQKLHVNFLSLALIGLAMGGIVYVGYEIWQTKNVIDDYQTRSDTTFLVIPFDEEDFRCKTSARGLIDSVELEKDWLLKGDEFKSLTKWKLTNPQFGVQDGSLELRVTLDSKKLASYLESGEVEISYTITDTDSNPLDGLEDLDLKLSDLEDNVYTSHVDADDLEPGKYDVLVEIANDCGTVRALPERFSVSYPVYVAWTIDWEGYNMSDEYLHMMVDIAEKHNSPMTHYFNPRLYVPGVISTGRQEYLTRWITERRDKHGESIGLHTHMFEDMVVAAGVEPLKEPAWGGSTDDGYDTLVMGYNYENMVTILNWAKTLFVEKGLGDPIMYRAGGWYADSNTLQALEDTGFVLDSSGRTAVKFGYNQVPSPWALGYTTQPYHPNVVNQNSWQAPNMDIWEFPNNGGDSWALSAGSMIDRFDANYDGTLANERTLVTFLSHPRGFNVDEPKIEELFTYIDKWCNNNDSGPVIYINMDDAYLIWEDFAGEY